MALTLHEDGTIVADDPASINLVRLISLKHALSLEIRTGMKMSRGVSLLALVNQTLGTSFKRKEAALEALTAYLDSIKDGSNRSRS